MPKQKNKTEIKKKAIPKKAEQEHLNFFNLVQSINIGTIEHHHGFGSIWPDHRHMITQSFYSSQRRVHRSIIGKKLVLL